MSSEGRIGLLFLKIFVCLRLIYVLRLGVGGGVTSCVYQGRSALVEASASH